MQRLVIGLVVVALLAIGIDRAAEFATGWVVGGRIADQTRVEHRPKVDFHGLPFLTQAARREFERVDVHLRGLRSTQDVRMERLDAELRAVRIVDGDTVTTETMTGRGLVRYRDLNDVSRIGAEMSYGGDGLVRITRRVDVLGMQSAVSALGRAVVNDGVLEIRPERFETGVGPLDQVVSLLGFTIRVPLRELPEGVDVEISAGRQGIDVRFSGKDLVLEQ